TTTTAALQGAFSEHVYTFQRLRVPLPPTTPTTTATASSATSSSLTRTLRVHPVEVRTVADLYPAGAPLDGLVLPGGESTAIAHMAERGAGKGLMEAIRGFVEGGGDDGEGEEGRPVWGTCAGMILLAATATNTKQGGQPLLGLLDVRVKRNAFGRQRDSFTAPVLVAGLGNSDHVPMGAATAANPAAAFPGVFIRAPVISLLDEAEAEAATDGRRGRRREPVHVLARVVHPSSVSSGGAASPPLPGSAEGEVVAVRQGRVFATAFHPELTEDARVHAMFARWVWEARCEREASALSVASATIGGKAVVG
ncbi:class I glutamine amidotransferase-like protein, partial [Zopfochytrium polystomum]